MDVQERPSDGVGRPLNEAAVRDIVRGLIGGRVASELDPRWTAEDPFWGGNRTTVATLYSPTLNRIWRLIMVGEQGNQTMQLVEVLDGTASYADLNLDPYDSFGPNRRDLAVVIVGHALIDAIADLS